jgi:pilus assembly protein CpaB
MRIKLIILLLVAGGAAAGAVGLARGWLDDRRAELLALQTSQPIEVDTIDTIEVLVAVRNMPSGTFLNEESFTWNAFPAEGLPESYFTRVELEDPESGLNGAVLRGAITVGEPLTEGRVVRPGDRGFLAAVLRPGLRAISVPVDATTGIAGFVFPGDRVDLLLTHEIEFAGNLKRLATETILSDIRVLAVDQRTDDTEGEPELAKTATLEVDTKQAETIAVALRMGRLSLALRALARLPDAPATATPSEDRRTYTWDSQASLLLPPIGGPVETARDDAPPPRPQITVTVIRRGASETLKFDGPAR